MSTNSTSSDAKNFFQKHMKLILGGIAAFVLIIMVLSTFGFVDTTRNEGIQKEAALVAQYNDNQNELSSYLVTTYEALGIADRQSEELNKILIEAVKGRYDNDGSLQPGTGGALFSSITEAYPDLSGNTELYGKVQDQIISGRNAYKNKQTLLTQQIANYNTWRESGLFKSFVVKQLGFPSDRLVVTANGQKVRGEDALDQIATLVLTDEARESYDSGTLDPIIMPRGDEETE